MKIISACFLVLASASALACGRVGAPGNQNATPLQNTQPNPNISTSQNTLPAYTGITVSGNIQGNWQKTTIPAMETSLGYKLPVPTYLPPGYQI